MGSTPRLSLLLLAAASLVAVTVDYALSELRGGRPSPVDPVDVVGGASPEDEAVGVVEVLEVVDVAPLPEPHGDVP